MSESPVTPEDGQREALRRQIVTAIHAQDHEVTQSRPPDWQGVLVPGECPYDRPKSCYARQRAERAADAVLAALPAPDTATHVHGAGCGCGTTYPAPDRAMAADPRAEIHELKGQVLYLTWLHDGHRCAVPDVPETPGGGQR